MYGLALSRPVSTGIATLTLSVLGAFSLTKLPVSLLPPLERPSLVVEAKAEGRSREEILHGLTEPLERSLASLPGVTSRRSETRDSSMRLTLETDWQTDPDRLRIEAERRLHARTEFRPDSLTVTVAGGDLSPVIEVAVLGGASAHARSAFGEKVLLPELARLPGAGRIGVLGSAPLHVVVTPRAADLSARALTASDVVARLLPLGRTSSAGRVRDGAALRPLLVVERVRSLPELAALTIEAPAGPSRLADVADLSLEEVSDGTRFSWNGRPGLLLRVYRAPGANAIELAAAARVRLAEIAGRTPPGLTLAIVEDRSREVVAALRELLVAALLGIVLGTLVLRVFLGSFRPTVSLSLVIPASLLISFGAFHAFGVPLDVVSLAGLALASGMLVDCAIVVAESIEVARARGDEDPALTGTSRIAVAVVASCLTTLVVFLPLLYLRGLARAFFGEQAFAVCASLGASLLLSLTLTPVLARRDARRGASPRARTPGLPLYERLLERALSRPAITLALATALTAVSVAALLWLPRGLFPEAESRRLVVSYRLDPDLAGEAADVQGVEIERRVRALLPEGALVSARRGLSAQALPGVPGDPVTTHGEIAITFTSASLRRAAEASLAALPSLVPEARVSLAPRPSTFVEAATQSTARLAVVASAPDEARVSALTTRLTAYLKSTTGQSPQAEREGEERRTLRIAWDEVALARLGLTRPQVEGAVRDALTERSIAHVDLEGAESGIRIRRTSPEDLPVIPIRAGARVLPLGTLARFVPEVSPDAFMREEGRPSRRLVLPGGDALTLSRALAAMPREKDETVRVAGEALEIVNAFRELVLAISLALLLVVLVVAAFYESLLVPGVVLTAVPVAAGGAFALLLLSGQSLNVLSMLGLLLLLGIVTNHTIVLVDLIERLRADGHGEEEALRRAGRERYRPVLMTTLTTLLGMLPLAILGGEGVELRRALSLTVLGGLTTSTLATLLVVPLLHRLVEPLRRRPV